MLCWLGLVAAYALAKAAKFVGVGGVPHIFVSGVPAKLAVFKLLARHNVKDRARKMDGGGCVADGYGRWQLWLCVNIRFVVIICKDCEGISFGWGAALSQAATPGSGMVACIGATPGGGATGHDGATPGGGVMC